MPGLFVGEFFCAGFKTAVSAECEMYIVASPPDKVEQFKTFFALADTKPS